MLQQGHGAEKHHGTGTETPATVKWVKRSKDFLSVLAGKMVNLPAPLASYPDPRSGDAAEVSRYWRNVFSMLVNHLSGLPMLIGI